MRPLTLFSVALNEQLQMFMAYAGLLYNFHVMVRFPFSLSNSVDIYINFNIPLIINRY